MEEKGALLCERPSCVQMAVVEEELASERGPANTYVKNTIYVNLRETKKKANYGNTHSS